MTDSGQGWHHRETCRICGGKDLVMFLDFGYMPLAGGFIRKEDFAKEGSFPLRIYFCRTCKEVQTLDVVEKEVLFKDYRFLSSVTKTLSQHFEQYAREAKAELGLDGSSLVVEFGSNDGVLLRPFMDIGIKAVGVEPAANIAVVAVRRGCTVVNDFFNERVVETIIKEHGKADMVCGNNVFAHIDDMHEMMRAIKLMLKDDGAFVFEVHYLQDLLETYQYDMIYHEHMMYHSLTALSYLLGLFGMEAFDVKRVPIHSGSIRVYAKNKSSGKHAVKPTIGQMLAAERSYGLDKEETFFKFAAAVRDKRDKLRQMILSFKADGKRIAGYGASGRASVHLSFCGLGPDVIDYIVDASPERYGRFTPGTHVPIVKPEVLQTDTPDFMVLFAWNYEQEVLRKEDAYRKRGGKFIIPLPEPKIV